MKKIVFYLLLAVTLTAGTAHARMGDGISIKGVQIDAKTDVTLGYDDNILLERDNILEDWFWNLRPYADFELEFSPENKLYFSWDADIYRFAEYDSENSESHVLLGGFDFRMRNLYGVLLDEYVKPQDRDGILYTNRIERSNHIPSVLLGLDFNRLAIEGMYRRVIARYKDEVYARDEFDEDDVSAIAYFHAFSKTDILLEVNYAELKYLLPGRDGDYYQARVGVKGQITSKLEGTVKAGYQDRNYDESDENYDEPVFETDLLYTIAENKSLDIKYVKSAKESLILGNNFYKLSRVTVEFRIDSPVRGILMGAGGFFENDKFPFTDTSTLRDDDVINFFLRLGYKFNNWLTAEVKYRYLDRDSNYDSQDYTQNVVTIYTEVKL